MELSFYTDFTSGLAQQEAQLTTLQQQVSSGVAVSTPDQNPGVYESATIGNDRISALATDTTNQANIQNQLGSVNEVYQSVSSVFDNVQSVVLQALNGTTSSSNMQALATTVTAASQQLVGLANTTNASGSYVFGGSRGSVQPFQTTASGNVVYMGDGGQSQAAISPDTSASTLANGSVFTSALAGDGYATVSANTANTGSGMLLSDGVANPATAAAFQTGSAAITLSFATNASGALTYTATQAGNPVASGAVTSGTTLQLGGVDYQLSGTPAAGDNFTISPSRPQSAFSLLQNIAATLASASGNGATGQSAQITQQLNTDLTSLAQYQQSVTVAQAQNGATLQAVSNASTSDSTESTSVQNAVQTATAVNVPAAITSLDETETAIQAAMKAFGTAEGLSLFTYL